MVNIPFYEYECPKCGVFETRENMLDNRLKECPTCGREIRMLFHPAPFIMKGQVQPNRVRGESGQLGHRVSETDASNIDTFSHQRSDSKGRAKASPTRPGPKTMVKMAKDAERS